MLLRYVKLLFEEESEYQVLFFILLPIAIGSVLIALTFHELSHGLFAYRLGDPTAKNMGRLSLNPTRHLDPIGTLMLLLVGFGWAKPVPVNPNQLRADPFRGMALVSFAGPLANLALAALFAIPFKLNMIDWHPMYTIPIDWDLQWVLIHLLEYVIAINLILAVFNLLPIPPMDGFKIVGGLLPRRWAIRFYELERYGMVALLIIVAISFYTGILWDIISAGGNFFSDIFLGAKIF